MISSGHRLQRGAFRKHLHFCLYGISPEEFTNSLSVEVEQEVSCRLDYARLLKSYSLSQLSTKRPRYYIVIQELRAVRSDTCFYFFLDKYIPTCEHMNV